MLFHATWKTVYIKSMVPHARKATHTHIKSKGFQHLDSKDTHIYTHKIHEHDIVNCVHHDDVQNENQQKA